MIDLYWYISKIDRFWIKIAIVVSDFNDLYGIDVNRQSNSDRDINSKSSIRFGDPNRISLVSTNGLTKGQSPHVASKVYRRKFSKNFENTNHFFTQAIIFLRVSAIYADADNCSSELQRLFLISILNVGTHYRLSPCERSE